MPADANGDLDLVMIAAALNHPILGLYAVPEITNAEQLRGRIVATDKPGTPTDYAARLSLSLLGLSPTDVDLRIVGSAAEVTPAMISGQVPAGVVAPPQSFQVEGSRGGSRYRWRRRASTCSRAFSISRIRTSGWSRSARVWMSWHLG